MVANSHNSNAYTDQEKKFLLGPLVMLTLGATVFLYVYSTIPSRPYELHHAAHAEASHDAGHKGDHGAAKH
ncbi:MAG: hypothetical protein FJW36_13660 [Acidobacteria bacterium]|nr:hypothetical protein [Acidobacteriota bacterium]